ncbi:uracil-xanthine permease family protein [Pleurocapsa sp. FMAR1]|uniref:uracil-xanthine permease family protein n=1 Tax=Pleurocapsa sp. FMAR1 TaxID=3040204 RepID=UPI0029C878BD|nr:nucleobase:cation symporter-2 family protein [Pleurocapsa sp. FMAR1]
MTDRNPLQLDVSAETASVHESPPLKPQATDMIYGLEAKPALPETLAAALQHVLAAFVNIIAPALVVGNSIGLEANDISFLVSMSLFISGIATFIQIHRIGPIGSGLLSIQGTSFAFVGTIVTVGTAAIESGRSPTQTLANLLTICLLGSFIEIILSQFIKPLKKVITPLVSGIVVVLIGLVLIRVAVTAMAGGPGSEEAGTFASLENLGVSLLVLTVIVVLNCTGSNFLRMSAILIGLVVGYLVALPLGMLNFSSLGQLPYITVPIPFRYGFDFSLAGFIPLAFLYVITTIESIGDLTATSMLVGEPIEGEIYLRRVKGGILGDGVNSLIAACFNTFPNTTFSQNNGVIQLTGVGSRYVGYFIAGILVLLGLFPLVGGLFQAMPQPVLGGATLLMFSSVVASGIKILQGVNLSQRNTLILIVSLGLGMGVSFVPEILENTPYLIKSVFSSGIATGGIAALVLNIIVPGDRE